MLACESKLFQYHTPKFHYLYFVRTERTLRYALDTAPTSSTWPACQQTIDRIRIPHPFTESWVLDDDHDHGDADHAPTNRTPPALLSPLTLVPLLSMNFPIWWISSVAGSVRKWLRRALLNSAISTDAPSNHGLDHSLPLLILSEAFDRAPTLRNDPSLAQRILSPHLCAPIMIDQGQLPLGLDQPSRSVWAIIVMNGFHRRRKSKFNWRNGGTKIYRFQAPAKQMPHFVRPPPSYGQLLWSWSALRYEYEYHNINMLNCFHLESKDNYIMEFDEIVENWKMFNIKIKWEYARFCTIDMQKCKNRRFRPFLCTPENTIKTTTSHFHFILFTNTIPHQLQWIALESPSIHCLIASIILFVLVPTNHNISLINSMKEEVASRRTLLFTISFDIKPWNSIRTLIAVCTKHRLH